MNVEYILSIHGIGGGRSKSESNDKTPPPPVVGLNATANGDNIDLTWQNPNDTDFVGVRIMKNESGYPASENDGVLLYDGDLEAFTDVDVTKGTYIYYRVFTYDFDNNYQSDGSQIARGVVKADQAAPTKPVLKVVTYDVVTLEPTTGHEYSLNTATWQTSNVFEGLEPNTPYTFYQRKAETELFNPSPASPGLTVTTNVRPYDDPYNSPGGKTLIAGTTTQGFFGEVNTTELISGTALASMIGLSEGITQFDNEPWLKFMLDEKVLFVAKKPYRHTISWDAINAANAVYGGKEITIGGNRYKVRLLKTSLTDPARYEGASLHGGEWNRLILPIHEKAQGSNWTYPDNVGPNDVPSDWGIRYTDAQLGTLDATDGSFSWMQETAAGDVGNRLGCGYDSASFCNVLPSSLAEAFIGWRPCLEVVS